jgi:tetratricopeptide (TPR) repeat protein
MDDVSAESIRRVVASVPASIDANLVAAWHNAVSDAGRSSALRNLVFAVEHTAPDLAIELARHSTAFAVQTSDVSLIADAALLLAVQLCDGGHIVDAEIEARLGLSMAAKLRNNDPIPYLRAISVRGLIAEAAGDDHSARRDYETVLMSTSDPITVLAGRVSLASLELDLDRPERALEHLAQANSTLDLADDVISAGTAASARRMFDQLQASSIVRLADQQRALDARANISKHLQAADELCAERRRVDSPDDKASQMLLASIEADVYRLRGDVNAAAERSAFAVALADGQHTRAIAAPYVSRAKYLEDVGEVNQAIVLWNAALEVAASRELVRRTVATRLALAYERLGDFENAFRVTRSSLATVQPPGS